MTKTPEQVRRAYETLDHIERHPEKHDQNWWLATSAVWKSGFDAARAMNECGTTACTAGWTVLLAGETIHRGSVVYRSSGIASVEEAATELLGLTSEERCQLFFGADDLADVRKVVFEIFGPRPDGVL